METIEGLPAGSKILRNGYVQLPNGRMVPPHVFGLKRPDQPDHPPERMTAKRQDTLRLLGACKEFTEASEAPYNTIYPGDFAKYAPLFNSKAVENMDRDVINKLRKDYGTQFSLRHPIYLISTELDPEGAYYFRDKKHHKVLAVLPPAIKNYRTLNALGRSASDLIASFMNASANTENPLDHRMDQYAAQIALALKAVNKDNHGPDMPTIPGTAKKPAEKKPDPKTSSGSSSFDFDW